MIARQAFRTIRPVKRVTTTVCELSRTPEIYLYPARLAWLQYLFCLVADNSRLCKGIRRYAVQGASGGPSNIFLYGGIAAAAGAIGGGYLYFRQPDKSAQIAQSIGKATSSAAKSGSSPTLTNVHNPSNSTFTGGEQGWVSLKLESVEKLSHNTSKFRFALPNPGDVSGLHIACMYLIIARLQGHVTNCLVKPLS